MAPKLGVLPLMLLSWPPHRGERTSGAAGHKLAATIEWRAWVPPLSSPVAALLRSRSSPRQGRCMHPPTQGSITARVSNSQPHADQPERDSGHRAGDLEFARLVYARHRCAGGGAAKIRHPPFRPGCLQEPHKWALVSFLRIGTLRRHLTAFKSQGSKNWRHFWRTSTQFH
jgi:hypothetical protein